MRVLLIAVIAATALWSGYWFVGSRGMEDSLRGWLDGRAEAGWVAEYASVETRGFPNRFDTTISALDIADPASGVVMTAPFFQLLRLSYKLRHLIAIWPDEFTVGSPEGRVTVQNERARASLVFKAGTDWQLDRASVVFKEVRLDSDSGWSAEIAEGRLASRPSDTVLGAIDIGFELTDLRPANAALRRLASADFLPGIVQQIKVDAAVTFDAPWDRQAVEARRPRVTGIELNLMQVRWGKLELWAAGTLSVDRDGRASGSITVKAKNWREMFAIAVAAGWIPERFAGPLERALELLAGLSGSDKTLDAPLTFKDGQVSFGPLTLGTAPLFRLR